MRQIHRLTGGVPRRINLLCDRALLGAYAKGLQAVEDSLPYVARKRVREDIPVGVYDVIADFGQSRGTNTATILPNEAYLARRYGRTILLRVNIMRNPEIFSGSNRSWQLPETLTRPTLGTPPAR